MTDEVGQIFLAQNLTLGDAQPEGDEVLALRRLPLTEAYAMAMDGRITDGVFDYRAGESGKLFRIGTHPVSFLADPPQRGG